MKSIIPVLLFFSSAASAQNRIDREHFISLLQQKQYGKVFNEAIALREKVYGRCMLLDYFIAKSLCLDNYTEPAKELLTDILRLYPMDNQNRSFIDNERKSCVQNVRKTPSSKEINNMPMPQEVGFYAALKGGVRYDCKSKNRAIGFNNDFSEEDMQSRVFELGQQDMALPKIKSLLNDDYALFSRDRYLLVSLKSENITEKQLFDVVASLEEAYSFYVKYYNLRAPDKIITVYLLPDESSLKKTALKVHGASLPDKTLGYSLLSDLSLLGIASPEAIGTLYHELFHLIIRTDIGDIPAWLDEGIASLYSVSTWKNDTLYGDQDTWRIKQLNWDYLNETSQRVPAIKKLFSYNWQQFNGGDDIDLCQASINYALSNHLLIYLQQMGKLQPVVQAFKNRKPPGDSSLANTPDDSQILESALGYPVDSLQKRFSKWFVLTYNFNPFPFDPDASPDSITNIPDQASGGRVELDYKTLSESSRNLLDDLKNNPKRSRIDYIGLEKRYRDIDRVYERNADKLSKEMKEWRIKHAVKLSPVQQNAPPINQSPQQQSQPHNTWNTPEPTGIAKERMDGYKDAMEKERVKMKDLRQELRDILDKHFPKKGR